MFDRYTEPARRAIFFARYEASQFGSEVVDTEHLLLGLLRQDQAFFWRLVTVEDEREIRRRIEEARNRKKIQTSLSEDLPLTEPAKSALACAAEAAVRLDHKHIGPEHILLGLTREHESLAAQILLKHGIGTERVMQEIAQSTTDEREKLHALVNMLPENQLLSARVSLESLLPTRNPNANSSETGKLQE